jgi:hypothetical protein
MRVCFSGKEIIKVLDAMIGDTAAIGETNFDERAFDRLQVLDEVTEWCIDSIYYAGLGKRSDMASVKKVGNEAYKIMHRLHSKLSEVLFEADCEERLERQK